MSRIADKIVIIGLLFIIIHLLVSNKDAVAKAVNKHHEEQLALNKVYQENDRIRKEREAEGGFWERKKHQKRLNNLSGD